MNSDQNLHTNLTASEEEEHNILELTRRKILNDPKLFSKDPKLFSKDPKKQVRQMGGDGTNRYDSNKIPEHDNAVQVTTEDAGRVDDLFNQIKPVL